MFSDLNNPYSLLFLPDDLMGFNYKATHDTLLKLSSLLQPFNCKTRATLSKLSMEMFFDLNNPYSLLFQPDDLMGFNSEATHDTLLK